MAQRQRSKYEPLLTATEEEERTPVKPRQSREWAGEQPPWKSIFLGWFLLALGILFFVLCWLHHTGHTGEHIKEGSEWGLATLGFLTFLPGAYSTWTAFAAWQGLQGYHFSDIPKID